MNDMVPAVAQPVVLTVGARCLAATREAPVMVAQATSGPMCGAVIREATAEEVAAWERQPARFPCFRKAVKVGDVLVDRCTGPGVWHGGAGF